MGAVILLSFGVIVALLAAKKGYSPALWFLAAGIIGLLILAFLPLVNEKSELSESERQSKKKTGDIIGGAISSIVAALTNTDGDIEPEADSPWYRFPAQIVNLWSTNHAAPSSQRRMSLWSLTLSDKRPSVYGI